MDKTQLASLLSNILPFLATLISLHAESSGKIPALMKLMGVSPVDSRGLKFHTDSSVIKFPLLTSELNNCARYTQHGGSGVDPISF